MALTGSGTAGAASPDDTLVLELATGKVVIEMMPQVAPLHVARIKELANDGFYDGVVFHRVIPGFMAQTGDPTGTGTGGSGRGKLKAEFSNTPFERGTIGMARTGDPNSADSQWFICFQKTSHLNGQYTVWGKVVEGMELVDKLATGEPPRRPDKIVKARVGG
jgi:peptidylprolyl isomerase